MLKYENFTGITNQLPEQRMKPGDLLAATDVNIGLAGEVTRRDGFACLSEDPHTNVHQAHGFMLATCGAALIAIDANGTRTQIHAAMGLGRIWYCNLPDGRVTVSNGQVHGITNGLTWTDRSVPVPDTLGVAVDIAGHLHAGQYRYHLTFVRLADHLEGPAVGSAAVQLPQGGLRLEDLPVRAGFAVNVYLSGKDGEGAYLAGTTVDDDFEYTGNNAALVLPCRTLDAVTPVVGTLTVFWRGRVLVAKDNVLWACRPSAPHLADWRDFKQLAGTITAVQPVSDGVYVGTTTGLIFLAGTSWDQLAHVPTGHGPVVPGSGVAAPGHLLKLGDGAGNGEAMLCIAGGEVVAGFSGGQTFSLTAQRYRADVKEVVATFREVGGVPQYLAIPQ